MAYCKMQKEQATPTVFFDASVILAGLISPCGGSAKLLEWIKHGKISGFISEIVLDEVSRHANLVELSKESAVQKVQKIFTTISPAPYQSTVKAYQHLVIDYGDAHILASCQELKTNFLVTLDKKHLLVLQEKVKTVKIVSPKQLIETLA